MAEVVKFASASLSKLQSYINSGVITPLTYVFCKDTNNLVFVDRNSIIQPVKGHQQETIITVDELPTENIRTDAFYFYNGTGYLYVNNNFIPVFKELSDTTTVPFVIKTGTPTDPIIVADLEVGNYMISGSYKIGGDLITAFSTSRKVQFIVDADEANKYITRFDGNKINVYTVNLESAKTTSDSYVTESWIASQGYTTTNYVDQAINDLYNKIAGEILITKVSQLENDCGYLTADDINGISEDFIADLF